MTWAFILLFISMLNIWSVFWAFNAMTLEAGFMMAESAEMGRRIGFTGSAISMMTTWKKVLLCQRAGAWRICNEASYLVCLSHFFSNTNKFIRLHGEAVKANIGSTDANIGQLKKTSEY